MPEEVAAEYNGGFIGLIRWGLYKRMIDTLPDGMLQLAHPFTGLQDHGDRVSVTFQDRETIEVDLVVGADGIDSAVRKVLWGDSPKRPHNIRLFGGWFLTDEPIGTRGVFSHDRTRQGSYTPILHEGRGGYEWWMLEKWPYGKPFSGDVKAHTLAGVGHFAEPLPTLIAQTPAENTHTWEIVDRKPLKQWSKGRVTIIGDAAHPTSPYAAYGAGMSIEDGYFLAVALQGVDASDTAAVRRALEGFEGARKSHTAAVSQQAHVTGKLFHHLPAPWRVLRDLVFDHTALAQKTQGDPTSARAIVLMKDIDTAAFTSAAH